MIILNRIRGLKSITSASNIVIAGRVICVENKMLANFFSAGYIKNAAGSKVALITKYGSVAQSG